MSKKSKKVSNEDIKFNEVRQSNPTLTQEDKLRAIPYHSLKKEFAKLGIESAWSAGQKKESLIKKALQKLEDLKTIPDSVSDEVKEDKLKEIEDQRKDAEALKELKDKEMAQEKQEVQKSELELKYTLENGLLDLKALERALRMVTIYVKRVKRTEKERRTLLVTKKAELQRLIEVAEKQ